MEDVQVVTTAATDSVPARPGLIVFITAVVFFALGYGAAWFAFNSVFQTQDEIAQTVQTAVNQAFAEFDLNQPPSAVVEAPAVEEAPAVREVSVDDDPALGPEDAPIVIVEFSDFRCGFCGRFHNDTFPAIMEQYEGQIRFVYRDFPVVGGEQAALAAECVHDQGEALFWDYHALLFENQQSTGSAEALTELASTLDIDADAFETCLADATHAGEIQIDVNDGLAAGVRGTPAFFINGRAVVGAQPLTVFQQIIDEELAAVEAG